MSNTLTQTVETNVKKLQSFSTSNIFSYRKSMIVFSHLRWEFVKQRPKHIIERLSKTYNILFIEEPIPFTKEDEGSVKNIIVHPHLTVIQPRIEHNEPAQLQKVVQRYMKKMKMENPVVWFYSPAFVDALEYIDAELIIFDCMDELSAFNNASPKLIHQETQLLQQADIVFTGGKSLYDKKKERHNHVYCFPSSVDKHHFALAAIKSSHRPKDMQHLATPIVGYYGVIDERIDLDLLRITAQKLPLLSFVMIGPVVKIDPTTLPQAPNIHYLGSKDYSELPDYLTHFDIAMMPFALNKSTEFISPTKTLEFMSASKRIVSTPIYDVVRDYSDIVWVAEDPTEFSKKILDAFTETADQKNHRVNPQKTIIENTSWDKTVKSMESIIEEMRNKKAYSAVVRNEHQAFALQPQVAVSF